MAQVAQEHRAPPYKKKNKKTFLQKAKKFGKQGRRGQGHEIGQDQYDYLVRVLERWREGFGDKEEKDIFVRNVFEQTIGEEKDLSRNQLASRVLELLMQSAPEDVQHRFREALSDDMRIICTDSFSSHVLEKLLLLAAFSPLPEDCDKEDVIKSRKDWLLKVSKFTLNNLGDFYADTYASHIVRTVVQCMAGQRLPPDLLKSRRAQQQVMTNQKEAELNQYQLGEDGRMEEVLSDAAERLVDMGEEIGGDELGSGVVQVFLVATNGKQKKITKLIVKFLLSGCLKVNEDCEEGGLREKNEWWEQEPLVRLAETVVQVTRQLPKLGAKVYSRLLEGKLGKLAVHPSGNYVVQRWFDHCQDGEQLNQGWAELSDRLEEVLANGCTGVVLSLVKASRRLSSNQSAVLAAITGALHCEEHMDLFADLLVKMVTREALAEEDAEFPTNLHGSLALQELLEFNKPIKVVNSLLAMEPAKLRQLLSDPKGSHITDKFVESATIGEKSREALVKRLQGEFAALACSKHGSRSLDAIWDKASIKMKGVIAEELSKKAAQLNSHPFGKFVATNCAISVWKHDHSSWAGMVTNKEKKKNIFSDILGDNVKLQKRKVTMDDSTKDNTEVVAEKKPKKEVADLVGEIFKDEKEKSEPKKMKKKQKQKSYLDDL